MRVAIPASSSLSSNIGEDFFLLLVAAAAPSVAGRPCVVDFLRGDTDDDPAGVDAPAPAFFAFEGELEGDGGCPAVILGRAKGAGDGRMTRFFTRFESPNIERRL